MKCVRSAVLAAFLLALAAPLFAAPAESWTSAYGRLLQHYVTPSGVKYAEWKANAADVQALQTVVDAIAREEPGKLAEKEQLAFYLNAYNAWILHEALAKYPTKSVKDPLFTFFLSNRIKVAGEQMSFNHLEKDIIRAKFHEPRVHFALNCASRSCPPLNPEPFTGEKLEAQLEKLATAFVNSDKGVHLVPESKKVELSEIFDWYRNDFKMGALAFINKRREKPLPPGLEVTFQKYDWSLNEAK